MMPWQFVVRRSQTRTVPSSPADAKKSSLGDISSADTRSVCARKQRKYRLSCKDRYRMAWLREKQRFGMVGSARGGIRAHPFGSRWHQGTGLPPTANGQKWTAARPQQKEKGRR